ncbi:putative diacylglycerol O-acyltransferase [invertebrate metagenome]|uniref:diacylglycerol O-acyltransferase n=1 Tax=invertebrate metagenome TaxID=1711999 RepID=A0A2H9T4A8_9ZZZZ
MEQLSALDTAFINLETGSTPMHIGCMAIYDPSTAEEQPIRFKQILSYFKNRLYKTPSLRNRYIQVPVGLDYPYWIADPDFDIEFHLRHIALPTPGDWRQLCIQLARLHARPLDMNRPPWEIYIIEGLDNIKGIPKGCYAMVMKIHHALIDGEGGAALLATMHDLGAGAKPVETSQPWIVDRIPTSIELLARASINTCNNTLKKSRVIAKYSLPIARGMLKRTISGKGCSLGNAPRTRFNDKVSPHRVFEAMDFPLEDIKRIARAINGVKVNDVVVAIISGALRRYLNHKGELPEQSLNAMVPVSIRNKKNNLKGFNQLSFLFPKIYTDIEAPLERLHAIHIAQGKAKSNHEAMGSTELMDLSQLLPNTMTNLAMRTVKKYNLLSHLRPFFNTVIANVAGPQIPLYQAGSKLLRFYGTGFCWDSLGLFHIVFSYNGNLTISATCCRDMMPDPAFYARCLQQSFDDLFQAIENSAKNQENIVREEKESHARQASLEKNSQSNEQEKTAKTSRKTTIRIDTKDGSVKQKSTDITPKSEEKKTIKKTVSPTTPTNNSQKQQTVPKPNKQ